MNTKRKKRKSTVDLMGLCRAAIRELLTHKRILLVLVVLMTTAK